MRESQKQAGVKYAQYSLVGLSNMVVDVGALNLLLLLAPTGSPEVLVLYTRTSPLGSAATSPRPFLR